MSSLPSFQTRGEEDEAGAALPRRPLSPGRHSPQHVGQPAGPPPPGPRGLPQGEDLAPERPAQPRQLSTGQPQHALPQAVATGRHHQLQAAH